MFYTQSTSGVIIIRAKIETQESHRDKYRQAQTPAPHTFHNKLLCQHELHRLLAYRDSLDSHQSAVKQTRRDAVQSWLVTCSKERTPAANPAVFIPFNPPLPCRASFSKVTDLGSRRVNKLKFHLSASFFFSPRELISCHEIHKTLPSLLPVLPILNFPYGLISVLAITSVGYTISFPQTVHLPCFLFRAAVFIHLKSPFAAHFKLCTFSLV